MMEAGRGRKEPLDGRAKRTGEGRHSSREELLWGTQNGREAQTSGGGRWTRAPSKWTFAPRLGKIGGEEASVKRERSGVDG